MAEDKKHPLVIEGSGGGKKQKKQRPPVEAPNTLQSAATGRILDLLAYGPIEGVIGGAKGVFLDGTPIQNENGTFNFEGVTVEFRNGAPDQDMIKGFTDVSNVREVNTEIRHDAPVVRSISNMDATSAIVTVRVNALYTRNADTGDTNGASVPVSIEVERGGAWTRVVSDNISGKTMSAYERSYRITLPEGGTGVTNIRVSRLNKESNTQDKGDSIAWSKLTEVVDVKQNYPGCALVGIEVDARQFANTLPSRQYLTKLSIIQVPTNYDPIARTYTGIWNGQFKWAWSDNPAWCFYDIASHPVIGANIKNINKFYLYELGKYCDELVDDGYGGKEPRFTFNTILSSPEDAITVFNTLTSVFRGMAYWGSDSVEVVADMPGPIRRQITPSDVIDGEFTYQGTALKERHSVAVVMWNDPENNYDQVPEIVELPEAIELLGYKEVEVTAVACTSRGQARRLGLWILYSEFYETQTVNFTTTVKNADFRPGDYFELLDPYRAGARLGGKVLKLEGTKVTLDAVPSEVSKGWTVTLEKEDKGLERYAINSVSGNVLTLAKSPVGILANSNFALSNPDLGARQFRVVSVVETDNHNYGITATEHNPGKYDFVEKGLKLPEKPTSLLPKGGLPQPTGLSAEVFTRVQGGTLHMNATVSWTVEEDPRLDLFVLDVKGPTDFSYRTVYTGSGLSVDMQDIEPGQWSFRVKATSTEWGNSPWFQKTLTLNDLLQPLPPQRLEISTTSFTATIIPVQQRYSISDYEFWRSSVALNHEEIESNALYLGQGLTFVDTGLKFDTEYFYYVRAVNAYGKSDWVAGQAKTQADVEDILEAVFDEANEGEIGQWLQEEIAKIDVHENEIEVIQDELGNISGLIEDIPSLEGLKELEGNVQNLQEIVESLSNAPTYDPAQEYLSGTFVKHDDLLWAAKKDVPAGTLPPNEEYWTKIGEYTSLTNSLGAMSEQITYFNQSLEEVAGELTATSTYLNSVRAAFVNQDNEGVALEAVEQWRSFAEATNSLTSLADAHTSTARRVSTLTATVGDNLAQLTQLEEVMTTEFEAVAKQITELKVEVGENTAEAIKVLETKVEQVDGKVTAQAQDISKLGVVVEGNTAAISNEAKVRAEADSAISQELSVVSAELKKDIEDVQEGMVKDLAAAITTETQARVDADEALGVRIETVKASADSNKAAISQEAATRADADSALSKRVDTVTATAKNNTAAITAETKARADADKAISQQITEVTASLRQDINDAASKVTIHDTRDTNQNPAWYWENHPKQIVEEFKRSEVIGTTGFGTYVNLQTRVYWGDKSGGPIIQIAYAPNDPSKSLQRSSVNDTTWTAWGSVANSIDAAVKSEATARASADEALGKRVDSVSSSVNANATAIKTETTARTTADTALGKRIDTVQATASGNTAAIQSEAKARADADTALGKRVDTVQASVQDEIAKVNGVVHVLNLTSLNKGLYYPVLLPTNTNRARAVYMVDVPLSKYPAPWATHNSGTFSCTVLWETNGSGWGARKVERTISVATSSFTAQSPFLDVGQLTNSSNEYIFLRGGAKYDLTAPEGVTPRVVTSSETISSQTIAPKSYTASSVAVSDAAELSASVQEVKTAQAQTDGTLKAAWGMKLQTNNRGERVVAGVGLDITTTGGVSQSNFIVQANNFIIQDGLNGAGQAAFAVTGGKVVIRSALIGDATITMAKIGGDLFSSDWVAGKRGWRLSQDGQFEINSTVAGQGRIEINNKGVRVYDANGSIRVKLGDLR